MQTLANGKKLTSLLIIDASLIFSAIQINAVLTGQTPVTEDAQLKLFIKYHKSLDQ